MGFQNYRDLILANNSPAAITLGQRFSYIADIHDWRGSGGDPSDTGMLQGAVNYAKTNRIGLTWVGDITIENEISFSGQTTPISLIGRGAEQSRLLVDRIGADKAVLRFANSSTSSRTSEKNYLANFGIQSISGVANQADPIGIYMPYSVNDLLYNIRIVSLGNTAFWLSSANNTRLLECWAVGGGFAVTEDDSTVGSTFSIASGGTSLSVASGAFTFNSGHVGKNIYIDKGGQNNNPLAATIVSQTGSACVISTPALAAVTGGLVSFELIKGTINSASHTLICGVGQFVSGDAGRWIYVEGAGASGGVLVTTIASVTSATTVELTDAAGTTATNQFVHFAPAFFTGDITADDAATRGLNDIVFDTCYMEQWQGPGWLIRKGTNIWLNTCKAHGIGTGVSRMGRTSHNYVFDATRSLRMDGGEIDYGCAKDTGNIYICGAESDVSLDGLQIAAVPDNQPVLAQFTTSSLSRLLYGNLVIAKDPTNNPPIVNLGSSAANVNMLGFGYNTARRYQGSAFRFNETTIKQGATNSGLLLPQTAYAVAAMTAVQLTNIRAARVSLMDNLIGSINDIGISLDFLFIFGNYDANAALVNVITPNNYSPSIATASPVFTVDRGYTGNSGSALIQTTFIPNSTTYYQQDNACFGVWSLTSEASASANNFDVGVVSPTPRADLRCRTSVDQAVYTLNDATVSAVTNTDGSGFFNAIRQAAGSRRLRRDTSTLATSAVNSTGVPAVSFQILAAAGNSSRSGRQLLFAWAGAGMSDANSDDFRAALNTYKNAVGA